MNIQTAINEGSLLLKRNNIKLSYDSGNVIVDVKFAGFQATKINEK